MKKINILFITMFIGFGICALQPKDALLFKAIMEQNSLGIPQLLREGANVDAVEGNGFSGLAIAASNGYSQIVKTLLKAGAQIDVKDKTGGTPLIWAASYGRNPVVIILLEKGAHVNAQDIMGDTPLIYAAAHGHNQVVKTLLKNRKIDLSHKNKRGETALDVAATPAIRGLIRNAELRRFR